MKRTFMALGFAALAIVGCSEAEQEEDVAEAQSAAARSADTHKAKVGKQIFNDTGLSSPAGQSCASCHDKSRAFTDPSQSPTSQGAVSGRFGNRNTPTATYSVYTPAFHYDANVSAYVGGQFWDGRASSLEEQANGPLLNPLEMNNPDKASVVNKVKASNYAGQFKAAFGQTSLDNVDTAYDHIVEAIAAYERTGEFAPFSSKYDAYLAGKATLTPDEADGLALFENPSKGNCASCHPSQPAADGTPPLFTDFTYDNLGIPKNLQNPFYNQPQFNPDGSAFVDRGLGATLSDPSLDGAFKVPTLRNLSKTGPYTHAGYFTTLKSLVHFYNTRDTEAWPAPEVASTMNTTELGDLGLTSAEEDKIVAFLGTLTDGNRP